VLEGLAALQLLQVVSVSSTAKRTPGWLHNESGTWFRTPNVAQHNETLLGLRPLLERNAELLTINIIAPNVGSIDD